MGHSDSILGEISAYDVKDQYYFICRPYWFIIAQLWYRPTFWLPIMAIIIGFILPGESNEVWMTIQDLLVIEGRLVDLTLRELIEVWTFTFYSVFQFDEIIHVENAIFGCQQAYLSATVDECVINSRSRTTALNYVYNKISDLHQKYKVDLLIFC